MESCKKKVSSAKLNLFTQRNTTFFSALLAQLQIVWTEKHSTAATDGTRLYLNKDFIESLDLQETIGLLLHETYHVVLDHINRRQSAQLNPKIWNIAGDYVINGLLDHMGYKLPTPRLLDHQYDNLSTRQVYDKIHKKQEMQDLPFEMDVMAVDGDAAEQAVNSVVKAVTQARISGDYGSVPGEVARRVEEILNPKLPWEQILLDYMVTYAREDYTWSRPSKRYWPDMYLPSMHSEALEQITVGIDSSSSIDQRDLDAFMAEVKYIFDVLKPQKLRVMVFDTRVRDDRVFEEGDEISDLTMHGGGGTNIHHLMKAIEKDCPEITLIFTDMEFSMPSMQEIVSDVYWIQIGEYSNKPPKGTVIPYDS